MARKGAVSVDVVIKEGKDGLKKLTLDADALRKIMETNIQVAQRFEKKVFGFAALTTSINAVDNAFGQLSSTLLSITGESEGFNKAMKEANTMAGKDSAGFKQLKGEVADLAKEIPIARDQLANGLYQTISNGVPEDNWIEFLNTSARSAVGGLADINKVVGVTSTLIKNYGLEWSAAADIQDKIQLTAKNGVTSFEQLSQALPRVTGNAATLGVSIDELTGTFATLTGVSGNTAEVSTQLAAIFTALVKPSSEAAEMAAKMGIQFDAASIKAAGGFQNFLHQLDASVKAYAKANGVLEQEVYGKLFGSAEAIRALIPLQGELSDKFAANVSNMVNSAGTMDAAYADMSSHGEAVNQMLRNQWGAVIDIISGVTSAAQPYINFTAGLLSTGSSAAILVTTFKQLNIKQLLVARGAKLTNALIALVGLTSKKTRLGLEMLAISGGKAAAAMVALKIALRGLLVLSGIGGAVVAVTSVIGYFSNAADKAADSVEKLDDATDEYTQAAANAKVQIDRDIKALGDLIKAKKDTTAAIQHLNETYGDSFGVYQTAAEWQDVLIQKSRLYIKQIGYEAQARALASKVAEASIKKETALERKADLEKSGKDKATMSRLTPGQLSLGTGQEYVDVDTPEYQQVKKDLADAEKTEAQLHQRLDTISKLVGKVKDEMSAGISDANKEVKVGEMTWQQLTTAIENTEKSLKNTTDKTKIKQLRAYNEQLKARKKVLEGMTGLGMSHQGSKTVGTDKEKTRIQEIESEIDKLSEAYLNADQLGRMRITRQVSELNKEKNEIQSNLDALDRFSKLLNDTKGQTQEMPLNPEISRTDISQNMRDTYDHATQKVQSLRADFEIGIIGEEELMSKIDAVNKALESIGLNPIKIKIDSSDADTVKSKTQQASEAIGELGGAFSSVGNGLEIPELNIAGTLAQAVASLALGYAQASSESAALGPFGWVAFTAAGLAQLLATIATVKSAAKFASGGIVGGSSTSGDKLLVRVNSGEMILNSTQQKNLFRMLNTPKISRTAPGYDGSGLMTAIDMLRSVMHPAGQPVIIGGTLRASGRNLVCTLANETRIAGKSGKRTNIEL